MPVPEPPDAHTGFLVVKKPSCWWASFQAHAKRAHGDRNYWKYVQRLHAAISSARPDSYRGIDRTPVDRWIDSYAHMEEGVLTDIAASKLIQERLGPDLSLHWNKPFIDPDLLPDVGMAREVMASTDEPDDWEIIGVSRLSGIRATGSSLGFDVGYWGGDHYSIVRDSMLAPEFHGPPEEELGALAQFATQLNAHMLFESDDAADQFRSWYRDQQWAETEMHPDEFQIIEVRSTPDEEETARA